MKEKFGDDVQVVGSLSPIDEDDKALLGPTCIHGNTYSRLFFGKMYLSSSTYNRGKIKDNAMVCYKQGETLQHGIVQKYASYCEQQCQCQHYCKHYAIIVPVQDQPLAGLQCRHIYTGIPQ